MVVRSLPVPFAEILFVLEIWRGKCLRVGAGVLQSRKRFYNIWLESHDCEYDFAYEQHHLDAYSEGLEYLNWVLELSDEDPVFLAGAELRTLFPALGALLD